VEPFSILGAISAVVELAKASGDAMGLLRKTFPESSRFWKHFEEGLKNDRDVPWQEIRNRCYLQPSFFGLSTALVLGDAEARAQMEAEFASFVKPPEEARYDKPELVRRIMAVADKAASEAADSDRAAALAGRHLIEDRIAAATKEIQQQLALIEGGITRVGARVTEEASARVVSDAEMKEALERIGDRLNPGAGLDFGRLEALLDQQAEKIVQRLSEGAKKTVFENPNSRQADNTVEPPEVAPIAEPGGVPAGESADAGPPGSHHLRELAARNAASADRLRQLVVDGGVFALASAVRRGDLDQGPDELLFTAGRLLATAGFFAEAESAYLKTVDLVVSDSQKARNYVGAAGMASVQGSEERYRRHLDSARELVANHPALLIAEARSSSNSQYMLDHVADVEPESDAERALLEQTRAQALLALGDEDGARRHYELALQADACNGSVREFGAILPFWTAQRRIEQGLPVNAAELRESARIFADLAREVTAEGRIDEAAKVMARAAVCHLFIAEFGAAGRLLESVADPGRLSLEAALALGNVAVNIDRPDLALRFLPAGANDVGARLIRVQAQTQLPTPEERAEGVEGLRTLLGESDEQLVLQAAFGLISAAAMFEDVPWDERAAELVAANKPDAEAAMRAERALLLGDAVEAQRILLPYSARTASMRRVRDYAAIAGEWEKVKDRSRQLLREQGDPRDRLALAEALRHLGNRPEAEREFRVVVGDRDLDPDLRQGAFGGLAEIAGRDRDYEALRGVAEEWLEAFPESANAIWNLLFSLVRLSRHDEAWRHFDEKQPQADTPERATVLAEILRRAAPKQKALQLLIGLSDRFDRKVEALEALVIAVSLDAERDQSPLDPVIEERVGETFAGFPTRFPDSNVIRQFQLPETPEEIVDFFKEMAGDRPKLQHDIATAIAEGRAPVNALAAVSTGGVGKNWAEVGALPLRFAMNERDAQDEQTARERFGAAAVWDPSSLYVVVELIPELEEAIRLALPGSMIAIETLEDADSDEMTPGKPTGTTLHTIDGEFGFREFTEEELDREERRVRETLRLAKALDPQPAKGPGADAKLLEGLEGSEDRDQFQLLFATLLLAQRTGRAIYSDDRFIREAARSIGVEAFDTLALLDAMVEHELIDAQARVGARRALARRGGWGVRLTGDELVALAADAGFQLSPEVRATLHDRADWRSSSAGRGQKLLVVLAAVHAHDPAALDEWLAAILRSAQAAVPEVSEKWTWLDLLLVFIWFPEVREAANVPNWNDFVQALLAAAKRLGSDLVEPEYDPVLQPIARILDYFSDHTEEKRFALFMSMTERLTEEDRKRAFDVFIERPDEEKADGQAPDESDKAATDDSDGQAEPE
jgi:tetratricopeptide (TPR) repeat protein